MKRINFLGPKESEAAAGGPNVRKALAPVVVWTLACAWLGIGILHDGALQRRIDTTEAHLQALRTQRESSAKADRDRVALLERLADLDDLAGAAPAVATLDLITRALPQEVGVSSVQLSEQRTGGDAGSKERSARTRGAYLVRIEGAAAGSPPLTEFLRALTRDPWLHEVRLVASDASSARSAGACWFAITAAIEPSRVLSEGEHATGRN